MTSIYINNTQVPEIFNNEFKALLDNLNIEHKDKTISLTIELPNYSTEDVTQTYIHNFGTIPYMNSDKKISKSMQVMMAIFLKYPEYVHLKDNDLSDEQIITSFKSEQDVLSVLRPLSSNTSSIDESDDYYEMHKDSYDRSLKKIVDMLYTRYNHNDIIYHMTTGVIDVSIEIFMELTERGTAKYIKFMYDVENENYIKYDYRYVEYNSGILTYTKHPYGYREGMKIVTDKESLFNELEVNTKNIYINGDITIDGGCSEDNPVLEVDPEDFATWAIGPKCRVLESLMCFAEEFDIIQKSPPRINDWAVEHLEDCNSMLDSSGVEDLSDMHFYSCKNANSMFGSCRRLRKAPKFYNLVNCEWMFTETNLESIDDSIVSARNIKCIDNMFNCANIKHVFNNKVFKELREINFNEGFDNCNITSAFNNCKFHKLERIYYKDCGWNVNIKNLLNDCKFIIPLNIQLYDDRLDNKFENVLNNCVGGDIKSVEIKDIQ